MSRRVVPPCHVTTTCPSPRLRPPPACTALQLELYRDTRESILSATQQPNCLRDMSPAARDRALEREMRAEKNLHPALQTPDGHYKVQRGCGSLSAVLSCGATRQLHVSLRLMLLLMGPSFFPRKTRDTLPAELLPKPCVALQFLRAVSEGAVAYLLDMPDLQRPVARVVSRELLAACVFRPLMMWATPYYANKALFTVLKEQHAAQVRLGWARG